MSAALPDPSMTTAAMPSKKKNYLKIKFKKNLKFIPSLSRSLMIRIASMPPSKSRVTIGIPSP